MGTTELLEQLCEKPKEELEFVLSHMMLKEKIDYVQVSNAYMQLLKEVNKRNELELSEKDTCIFESFIYDEPKSTEENRASIQRRLYALNSAKRFQLNKLNEKYGYNEEYAKTLTIMFKKSKLPRS